MELQMLRETPISGVDLPSTPRAARIRRLLVVHVRNRGNPAKTLETEDLAALPRNHHLSKGPDDRILPVVRKNDVKRLKRPKLAGDLDAPKLRPVGLDLSASESLHPTETPNLDLALPLAPAALNGAKTPVAAVLANQKRMQRRKVVVPHVAATHAPARFASECSMALLRGRGGHRPRPNRGGESDSEPCRGSTSRTPRSASCSRRANASS